MDDNVVPFIRDRFNSLETTMTKGFTDITVCVNKGQADHNARIRKLEDAELAKKTRLVAYGSVGGMLASVATWFIGKLF